MPRTRSSCAVSKKRKVSRCSRSSKLSSISEDPCNNWLEKFELEFAFRLKQYDQLLEEKLAVLNRAKEKLKVKYSTMLEPNTDKENTDTCAVQEKSTQMENVVYSLQGLLGKQLTERCKEKNKIQALVPYSSAFQTPAISTGMASLPPITPKVAMNTPISMLRFPRQGEIALSMSGSPLMITAMSHESKPNINIPINSQQILSLVPHESLDPNTIPELQEEAMEQLEALNKNLLAFINLTSSNNSINKK